MVQVLSTMCMYVCGHLWRQLGLIEAAVIYRDQELVKCAKSIVPVKSKVKCKNGSR